jgi:FkbM family methyltransferase
MSASFHSPTVTTEPVRLRLARLLTRQVSKVLGASSEGQIWIDVGAHLGEYSFGAALVNPKLTVFAFEPDLKTASKRLGLLPNYIVIPMAVSGVDGVGHFFVNSQPMCSSMLPLNPEGVAIYQSRGVLAKSPDFRIEKEIVVPCTRLDTFMSLTGIESVQFLKIDAQGTDFEVVKSAGERLRTINRILLEVPSGDVHLYQNECSKEEVVAYMKNAGFELDKVESIHSFEENLTFVNRSL